MNEFFNKFVENPFWHNDSDEECLNSNPPIWVYGIEAGIGGKITESNNFDYSIDRQLEWPFNRNVFKLLSAILVNNEEQARDYKHFAYTHQPFVSGSNKFYKGNLFSIACRKVSTWTDSDAASVGGLSKLEYQEKSRLFFSNAHKKICEVQPKLFLATGLSHARDFSQLIFGFDNNIKFQERYFDFSLQKRILYCLDHSTKVFILPHLSGRYKSCLSNENEIFEVGRFIREKIDDSLYLAN